MHVRITERAMEQLKKLDIEPIVLRVDVKPSTNCSVFVDIELTLDELNKKEVVYEQNGLYIQMDSYAKEYIGDELNVDYGTGFRLYTPNETLAYGMSVRRKK
ncbi:iron-sulfur cluster biosynthesis family protein [Ectobacillus panaciterrae]|uniref:iron-sulfur cluster biosynthesis family protein n=1 Tax=Ectobacillus panaciterrae TaxID=363872 RepID=UPI0004056532|nr:iron-sulfur cluster biosynthesis family protein [Ectobacillus panaciterrae]